MIYYIKIDLFLLIHLIIKYIMKLLLILYMIFIIIKLNVDISVLKKENILLHKLIYNLKTEIESNNINIKETCGLYDEISPHSTVTNEHINEIKMPQPIIVDNMNEIRIESANIYLPIVDIQSNKNITIHVPRDRQIYTE